VNERKALEATTSGIVSVLTDILSLADRDSFGRAQRVRDRATALADELGLGRPWSIEIGALLCRVGNMTVPESVQAKAAARTPLTPAEAGLLRRVPEIGSKVLSHLPQFAEIAALIRWHDARYDGSEEPDAPRGDALPIGARILKVAHDSIGLEQHLTPEEAWSELSARSGWYDPAVLAALERLRRQEGRPGTARFEVRAARRGSLQCGWRLHQDCSRPTARCCWAPGTSSRRSPSSRSRTSRPSPISRSRSWSRCRSRSPTRPGRVPPRSPRRNARRPAWPS